LGVRYHESVMQEDLCAPQSSLVSLELAALLIGDATCCRAAEKRGRPPALFECFRAVDVTAIDGGR